MDLNISDSWEWDAKRWKALHALEGAWLDNRRNPKRWEILRNAYAFQMPDILAVRSKGVRARTNPYFLDWDFTPIEYSAWSVIRALGLPFYPQVPALNYFLDFADPYFKIGIELDGKDYHERKRDTQRDKRLWGDGWRVFRIAGKATMPLRIDGEIVDGFDPDTPEENFEEWMWNTDEGIIWAIGIFYYGMNSRHPKQKFLSEGILSGHRYVEFPLYLDGSDALS